MSTNKTQNYNLHSWLPADDFLRTEINENFTKLDTALSGLLSAGAYTGDGRGQRTVSLGFTPRAVLVMSQDGSTRNYYGNNGGLALSSAPVLLGSVQVVSIVEGGFRVVSTTSGSQSVTTNGSNMVYHYLALR